MSWHSIICALALCAAGMGNPSAADQPPLPPSPVEPFRQWLEMPPAEREKQLAEWPAANQEVLRAKLAHYEKLPREERERRLAMLDLRYYLSPLLPLAPSPERDARLAAIPGRYRETVQARLAHWDNLPPEARERLSQGDMAIRYLTRIRRRAPDPIVPDSGRMDPRVQDRIQALHRIPPGERRNLSERLTTFFGLPIQERQRTLRTLSEKEREEIQRSLDALNRMTPEQRAACIRSFSKLANMTSEEQVLFLQNAARWQAMTPEERETWKNLVHNLPPLPPEMLLPPLPPVAETASGTKRSLP